MFTRNVETLLFIRVTCSDDVGSETHVQAAANSLSGFASLPAREHGKTTGERILSNRGRS